MTAGVKRLMRSGAGLILALLLGEILSPSAFGAVCGEHVVASKQGASERQALVPASGSLPAPIHCTGPACSGREAPPLVPVVPTSEASDSWGCLPCVPRVPLIVVGRAIRYVDERPLPPYRARIFHPPRL